MTKVSGLGIYRYATRHVTPSLDPHSHPDISTVTDESQHRSELDEVYELSVVRSRSGPELADGEA